MELIGKKIHYKKLIEFKGEVISFDKQTNKYKIKVTEWIGKGYPHLFYYLSEEETRTHSSDG